MRQLPEARDKDVLCIQAGKQATTGWGLVRWVEKGRYHKMMYFSVTEVLSPFADFSKIPPAVLEAAATRGTAVHDICANIARGLLVMNVPSETAGYVASYQRWFDLMVDEVLMVEMRLVDTALGYHGEEDLIVRSKAQEIILVDLKTPVNLIMSWRIQLAGYRNLAVKEGITPDRVGSLRLDPDGGIAKMKYYDNSLTDFNYFLQALNLYRLFNTK
jgi:hypothetical protein